MSNGNSIAVDTARPGAASAHPADPILRYASHRLQRLPLRDDLYRQRVASKALPYQPLISLITPIYDTPPDLLDRMLQSVRGQTYPSWEHCLVDDGSAEAWLARHLERLSRREPRIRFLRRETNGGIVAASNDALGMAPGEFISMLDHDDELDPQALFAVVTRLNVDRQTDIFYSDFDTVDRRGRHIPGWFLPDWSPDLLLTFPALSHLSVFRRSLVEQVGGWRAEYEGSQDYDLALRTTSVTDRVVHIPEVLYHWRRWERSVAANPTAKPYAYAAGRAAVSDHLRRNNVAARRKDDRWEGFHSVRYDIAGTPLVSVIALGPQQADTRQVHAWVEGLRSLLADGGYDRHEVILVVGPALVPALADIAAADVGIRLVPHEGTDDGDRINAGAAVAEGDHLVFLPETVSAVMPGWLSALLEHSQRESIGAVGSRLATPEGVLWHVGFVLPRGVPYPVRVEPMLVNYSAVSGTGMMTPRKAFEAAEGFRPESIVGHPDLDYCLRLRQLGYRHITTSHSHLRFAAPIDAAFDPDPRFVERWRKTMHRDPYYNPNFRQDTGDFALAIE